MWTGGSSGWRRGWGLALTLWPGSSLACPPCWGPQRPSHRDHSSHQAPGEEGWGLRTSRPLRKPSHKSETPREGERGRLPRGARAPASEGTWEVCSQQGAQQGEPRGAGRCSPLGTGPEPGAPPSPSLTGALGDPGGRDANYKDLQERLGSLGARGCWSDPHRLQTPGYEGLRPSAAEAVGTGRGTGVERRVNPSL